MGNGTNSGRVFTAVVTIVLVVLAWLVVVYAPSTAVVGKVDLLDFALFIGVWAAGMIAMMLPSILPTVLLLAEGEGVESASEGSSLADPAEFLTGYLGFWSLLGVLAFFGLASVYTFIPNSFPAGGLTGAGSGVAIALAGIYEVSPVKQKALVECRSPMTFILTSWRTGFLGRLKMGVDYSFFCTRCCWALMVILLLVGSMSLVWMVLLAGVIFVEKVLPHGAGLSMAFGGVLIVSGIGIASFGFL